MDHFSEAEFSIENFSCWKEEVHGSSIRSAGFTSLLFSLFPKGYNGQEVYMKLIIHSPNVLPPGELSFLYSDGSLIHSQQVTNLGITFRGPQLEEVLTLLKEKEEDRLVLRYRFKSGEETKEKYRTVIDVIHTNLKIDPVTLRCTQKISDFIFQKSNRDHYVRLTSTPEGNLRRLLADWTHRKDVILVKTCVSFLRIGDVLEKYEEKEHVFRGREQWAFFSMNKRELVERSVAVLVRLKIVTGMIHSDPSFCINGVSIVPNKSAGHTDDSLIALSKELRCVFQHQDFSDFQLKCGGVSFPVHKVILSARSPVFKLMLSSDMREAASGSVDIEDLDAPTLARFLAFLYTGAVGEDLTMESALKLYYTADKYEVSTLKKDCGKFVSANVSVSTVCDVLSLADKHGDDHLTEVSHSFILENYHQVLASENWKIFIKKEPSLAAETLTHFARDVHVKRRRCN